MNSRGIRTFVGLVLLVAAGWLGWSIYQRFQADAGPAAPRRGPEAAPVEVAEIQSGPLELRRTFSGTLEATAELMVAPKVGGRVLHLAVDLGDLVRRGQRVAELDDDEFVLAVAQATADLEVAKANLVEASNALEIASRSLQRIETLRSRGVASASQLDTASAEVLSKQARLQVARAQLKRAEASVDTAKVRLGYTKIHADWTGAAQRVVAERLVDQGETVSANTPLLSIVELDPITGVIFVSERDYARLRPGQGTTLTTDAHPGATFEGRIERISPIFREATRQARVEVSIPNPRQRLKPGMFVRATVVLDRVESATIVPDSALTTRGDRTGVFLVREDGPTVAWREVTVGIRDGTRVQVSGEGLSGRVVTLGQHLVSDGARVILPSAQDAAIHAPPTDPAGPAR